MEQVPERTPARHPFIDRFPVVGYRIEQGDSTDERFYVIDSGAIKGTSETPPALEEMSEAEARAELRHLGLSVDEIEARIAWCRKWMATRILEPGAKPISWLPPL